MEQQQKQDDQPLGVPPSEFHPHRPDAPFKKRGKVKNAILLAILIVIVDILIYFFLIKPDDEQLLKAIEPLKPPTVTPTNKIPSTTQMIPTKKLQVTQLQQVTQLAKADLAKRLKVDPTKIKTVSEETTTWNDGSLGCPQPEMLYTQALVEGSKVVLSYEQKQYDYHAGTNDKPFLCESKTN